MSAMFSHAALSAASRKASFGTVAPPVDLGLEGPGRPEPVIIDDEMEDGLLSPPDLSASSTPLVRDVLPPAASASPEQEVFRRDLHEKVRSTFGASSASGAIRTYEAILRGVVTKVMLKLGSVVLPMRAEAQFYSFFGTALMLGPNSASPLTSHRGVRWNYVKLVKAALAYWHVVRGERAIFDVERTPRMGVFLARSQKVRYPLDA